MIYVTGDLHGDVSRFKSKAMRRLKKNDTLIVCGDFGFIWDDSRQEQKLLKWIGSRPYQVLFLEGTHDNLDLLHRYPEVSWQGGTVREISGRLKHLCRGNVFELEGHRFFVFGGGASADQDVRMENGRWWQREMPTLEETQQAEALLKRHNNQVDYIVTHQPSRKIARFLSMDRNDISILDAFLDRVRESCRFKKWYFGCVHMDRVIPPSEVSLFQGMISLEDGKISM